MARYRKIDTKLWNDSKFASLDDRAKLAFLLVLTHPQMTALGAMRASMAGFAAELGWDVKAFREAFQKASAKGMLEVDEKACFVGLPNFLKYNRPESPNVVRSWGSALDLIPECNHKTRLQQRVKAFAEGLGEAFREALPEAFRKPSPNQEQEQEQEQEQDKAACAAKGGGGTAEMAEVVASWNSLPIVVKCVDLTAPRRKALKKRLAEPTWRDQWRAGIARLAQSKLLQGEKKTWADFDWFVRDGTVTKILEGKYDEVWSNGHRPASQPNGREFFATGDAFRLNGGAHHDAR